MLLRSLAVREEQGDALNVAAALRNLTHLYSMSGRYEKAEAFMRRWLHVFEKIKGSVDPELAAGFKEHGLLLRKMHRKAEAARSEARAREILAAGQNRSIR
jgi:hypothetical protein